MGLCSRASAKTRGLKTAVTCSLTKSHPHPSSILDKNDARPPRFSQGVFSKPRRFKKGWKTHAKSVKASRVFNVTQTRPPSSCSFAPRFYRKSHPPFLDDVLISDVLKEPLDRDGDPEFGCFCSLIYQTANRSKLQPGRGIVIENSF